ncbi:MAG: hypothetical protein EXS36_03755 [Pedosphaera sp.]|nr:hypothetical protein [Pedosphaera sp.]
MKLFSCLPSLFAAALGVMAPWAFSQQVPAIVVQQNANRATPIALAGFAPEVRRILEFDLTVVGFDVVADDKAQYIASSVKAAEFAGALRDGISDKELFRRQYPGGGLRSQAHALAEDIAEALHPGSGLSRKKIAYKQKVKGGSEIFVSDFDGANPVQMTSDGSDVAAPAWVPGRMMLYYTSYRLNNPDVYSHNLTTGNRMPVARYSGSNISPAPSPDGSQVAMVLSKSGSPDLWVTAADGTHPRQLTRSKEDESSPCWSPDGRRICFTSRMDGRPALYTISSTGGAPQKLETGGITGATEPDWSPDGKWIAFTRFSGGSFQICVVAAAGGEAKILREGEDSSWGPNSRTLVFVRRLGGGQRTLSLLDVPTGRVKDWNWLSGSCSQPSWAR